ncbi:hypothetical protein [Clostridium sp. UBA1056]|uniref:hypothetical protein n=1 Tax=unclassified Clostridium TaxID=2614128 RepID=UPI003216230B
MKSVTKILGFIGFGLSIFVIILFMLLAIFAPGSDWKPLLFLLAICLPFIILGLVGTVNFLKKKILSGIFMILAGIATGFLGLMSTAGGKLIGGINMAVGFIACILYIVAAICCFTINNKNNNISQST